MCILFIAVKQHPRYPLIIAANRDEFHARPTEPMHWWPTKSMLAGKDLQANGTWLSFSKSGRLAGLTNYRQLPLKEGNFVSRGELPLLALSASDRDLKNFLQAKSENYQGFNLLFGDQNTLTCFDSVRQKFTPLSSGFHSICNGALDDVWPKMARGEQALEHYIKAHHTVTHDALLSLLQDTQQAPDELLPDTGIGLAWEKTLSAIMIQGEEYGTRSSCIYTLSSAGSAEVTEITYSPQAEIVNREEFSWTIASKSSF